jgi:hypothetical protein
MKFIAEDFLCKYEKHDKYLQFIQITTKKKLIANAQACMAWI